MADYLSLIIVSGIIVIGYFFSKVISRIFLRLPEGKKGGDPIRQGETVQTVVEKGILTLTMLTAIGYLGYTNHTDFFMPFITIIPQILLGILLLIIGSVFINILVWFLKRFFYYIRIESYIPRETRHLVIPGVITLIQVILYLVLFDVIFRILEVGSLQTLLDFVLYPLILGIMALTAIGLINPIRDISAKLQLSGLLHFRPGNEIILDSKTYTIKAIHNLTTDLVDSKDNLVIIPHRILAARPLTFKRHVKELDTLQDLQREFVAQEKSHCGPASVQMALSIFNYETTQSALGEMMQTQTRKSAKDVAGTHPQAMIDAAEKVTNGEVKGFWVSFERIYDLKNEVITWLNQEALVIVDYKKSYLFPDANYAHYSLVVGIRGDEFLVIDPSTVSGGVYYSDYRDILIGMDTYSPLIKGKRGYVVLAPKGTEAYRRLQRGMVYYHPSMYDRVTKRIEVYLSKLSHPRTLKNTIPSTIRKRLHLFESKEHVNRVWRPGKGK